MKPVRDKCMNEVKKNLTMRKFPVIDIYKTMSVSNGLKKQLLILISILILMPAGAAKADVPYLLKVINPTGISNPIWLTDVNGTLFFQADDGVHGPELWKSDGTPQGTVMIKDIYPGPQGSSPAEITNVNGILYFRAADANGAELWKSNGTPEGTVMVKDIYTGQVSSCPMFLTNVGGTLFFVAGDYNPVNSTARCSLWKSDGTADGTEMVKDIFYQGSYPTYKINNLTDVNGTLFFTALDNNGVELWKSDGTEDGTNLVKNIYPDNSLFYNSYSFLTNVGGKLFFAVNDGINGTELWKSDGTWDGTVMVKDIYPGSSGSGPANLVEVNGVLFFTATDGTNGYELWKSDGTADGTVMVKDINQGSGGSYPSDLINVKGTLFFHAANGVNGDELWKSDGTADGTVLVKDINPGPADSDISDMSNFNGVLFFTADDGVHGRELWQSDGTEAGTYMVADSYPGSAGSWPSSLAAVGKNLFFSTDDFQLWIYSQTDNNDCSDAQHISLGQTIYASNETGAGTSSTSCAFNDTAAVWFYFQPADTYSYKINASSEEFDTTLAVYNACGGDEIACNDDYLTSDSQIILNMTKGKTYYIRVAGFDDQTGNFQLSISAGDCAEIIPGDLNGDCKVNMEDFAILASQWMNCKMSSPQLCQ